LAQVELPAMASKKWVVVGGGGHGIMAREGKDMSTTATTEKLATGAVVNAEVVEGTRMKFSKVSGVGPKTGWVSTKAGGKDLLVEVIASEGGQAADALTKAVEGSFEGSEAMAIYKSLSAKDKAAATLLTAIPDLYLQENNVEAAVNAANEAVALYKSRGDKVGLAAAYTSLASAELAQEQKEKAEKSADEAIAIFKELNDVEGQLSVLQTKIQILLSSGQGDKAVEAARNTAKLGESAKDQASVGAARLLEADICMDLCRPGDAVKAAREAQRCYAAIGDRKQEAKAHLAIAYADMNNDYGEAVPSAHAAAEIFRNLGDVESQANATYTVATAHMAAIAIKQRTCLVPCQANTRGAIDAAKQASELFSQLGSRQGEMLAMQALRTVLEVNGIEAGMLMSSGSTDALMDEMAKVKWGSKEATRNVVLGSAQRGYKDMRLGQPPGGISHSYTLPEEMKSSLKFNPTKFSWRNAMDGYHFTFVWEQQVEGVGQNPRGGYRSVLSGKASRTIGLPMYHSLKSQFSSAPDEGPLMIHMHTMSSGWEYGTAIMATMSTITAALTCKMHNILYLVVNEAPPGTKDEENSIRQVYVSPSVLAILRSARLEFPNLNVGFLGLDSASWHHYRSEVIAALPDVLQSEETEIHFHKGTPLAGTLISNDIGPAVNKGAELKKK